MKKIVALVLAVVLVISFATVAFAGSYSRSSNSAVKTATTYVAQAGVVTPWAYNAATGTWTCGNFKNQWALIQNPYAGEGVSQWFYFDANGNMLTGWQKITGADGIARWFYLSPIHNGSYGACYLNGRTPDGYMVDANGVWVQ